MQTPTHYSPAHRAMYLQSALHAVQNAPNGVVGRHAAQMLRDAHEPLVPARSEEGDFAQIEVPNVARHAAEVRLFVPKPAVRFEPHRGNVQQQVFAAGRRRFRLGFVEHFAVQTEVDSEAEHAAPRAKLDEDEVFVDEMSLVEKKNKQSCTSPACC